MRDLRRRNPDYDRQYRAKYRAELIAFQAKLAAKALVATPQLLALPAPVETPVIPERRMLPAPVEVPVIPGMNSIAEMPTPAPLPIERSLA